MDLEDRELAVLEERLYSSIHHSYEDAPKIPDVAPVPSPALRIVSRTSVINNGQGTLPANMKRYWVDSSFSSAGERAPYPKTTPAGTDPKLTVPETNSSESSKNGGSNEPKRMFLAPYQSLLGNMDRNVSENEPSMLEVTSERSTVPDRASVPKDTPNVPTLQLKKKKQTKQNAHYVEKKLESLLKLIHRDRKQNAKQTIDSKKAKASKVRQRKQSQVVVAEIILNSSDEDSQPAKKYESTAVSLSDGEGDEVIIVPTPPPPKICIDCSDEEDTQSTQFALPKSKSKSKTKGRLAIVNSSRGGSPSNSSIMSDDFIGQHDRLRLNDSFTESIPSDDELERAIEGLSGKTLKDATDRVPSVSSEDTVCTSGDTTDQEKQSEKTGKAINKSKSHLQVNSSGSTPGAKSKKENAATKKTPSKQKLSKMATFSPNVKVMSPSNSKRSTGNKTSTGTMSNDTSNISKTPGISKARSKSPETLAMEIVRKQFETQQSREVSGKKAKAKKDADSSKETRSIQKSITQATVAPGTTSDKSTERIKNGTAATKPKTKKIPVIDDNVSSESDIDIFPAINNSSSPQGLEKSSRRSAASFFDQIGDVSSESDYDESFLQPKKTTEKPTVEKERKKRIGRKRKQYNSETYSDEDFACLLTDIIRAISDTEEEDDDLADNVNKESNARAASTANPVNIENGVNEPSTPSSKQDRNPKKKRKVKDAFPPADSTVDPMEQQSVNDNRDSQQQQQQQQPEHVVKKKKKLKDPKPSVRPLVGTSGSTPEILTDPSEKAHSPIDTVEQTQVIKSAEISTTEATVPPQPLPQIISDSTDEDVEIVENIQLHVVTGTTGESAQKTQPIGPDCAWNEEMKQFYNNSWADEDFNMDLVLRRMPYDSRHWPIVHKDRFPDPPRKELICCNCGDRGHMKFKCRNTPKEPVCFMCGGKGHKEPRCPKTICLNCGAKTRSFVRGCKSCARDADITCFSCGLRGHTQRSCPDLWRRYHSTIEDNVPLRTECEINPNARWCSICSKPGHQAYMCNDARRIFGHAIPNMRVSSYMPAYRREYNRCSKHRNDEQEKRLATDPSARYNLFSTDANDCEFNLHELASNENGFYFNFLKASGLWEKYERQSSNDVEENVVEQPEVLVQPLVAEAPAIESTPSERPPSVSQAEEIIQPEPEIAEEMICATEPCKEVPISMNAPSEVPVVEENSNYSFSEFHTEEMQLDDVMVNMDPPSTSDSFVPTENNSEQVTLSDFIPFTNDTVKTPLTLPLPEPQIPPALSAPVAPSPETPMTVPAISSAADSVVKPQSEGQLSDIAKVLLTKERATMLLSAKGTEFLQESGKKYNLHLSITFEAVGNVLLITGTPEAQEQFHEELVRYLTESEDHARNAKYFLACGPKLSNKMTRYIAMFLQGLASEADSVEELLKKFRNAKSDEAKERHRRKLNVQLFGVYGLRDGRKHLNVLRNQLELCMKANPWKSELSQHRRTIIDHAIRYIFSAYDHKHYGQFVKEYDELKQANKLKKLTFDDLGIPTIIKRPKTLQDELHKQLAKEKRKAKVKEKAAKQVPEKPSPEEKAYANFLRRATNHRPIDTNRPNQVDNSTRHIQQTQGTENMASSQWTHREWNRDESPSSRERYHWYRKTEALDHGQPSTSNVSRLADRANALRNQELNQLQRLQDMLR